MWKQTVLLLALSSAGCAAAVGTSGVMYVPKDAATTCASHCDSIGMQLGSVVIMANNVGCVCNAKDAPAASSAAAGGVAALMMDDDERRQQRQTQPASNRHMDF